MLGDLEIREVLVSRGRGRRVPGGKKAVVSDPQTSGPAGTPTQAATVTGTEQSG